MKGWGASCQRSSIGGPWSNEESQFHINILELRAAQLIIKTFTQTREVTSIYLQMDNMTALSYIAKMGGTKNSQLIAISQEIWNYLIKKNITISLEHLPGLLNVIADRESRNVADSSEWKLNRKVFLKITFIPGKPMIDLFASRVSHQLPAYISWKLDPQSLGQDAFQKKWVHHLNYAFPPFCLIGRVLEKVQRNKQV